MCILHPCVRNFYLGDPKLICIYKVFNKYSIDRNVLSVWYGCEGNTLCGHNPNFVDCFPSHKVISGGQNKLPKVLGCHRFIVSGAIITLRYTAIGSSCLWVQVHKNLLQRSTQVFTCIPFQGWCRTEPVCDSRRVTLLPLYSELDSPGR